MPSGRVSSFLGRFSFPHCALGFLVLPEVSARCRRSSPASSSSRQRPCGMRRPSCGCRQSRTNSKRTGSSGSVEPNEVLDFFAEFMKLLKAKSRSYQRLSEQPNISFFIVCRDVEAIHTFAPLAPLHTKNINIFVSLHFRESFSIEFQNSNVLT